MTPRQSSRHQPEDKSFCAGMKNLWHTDKFRSHGVELRLWLRCSVIVFGKKKKHILGEYKNITKYTYIDTLFASVDFFQSHPCYQRRRWSSDYSMWNILVVFAIHEMKRHLQTMRPQSSETVNRISFLYTRFSNVFDSDLGSDAVRRERALWQWTN